MKNLTPLLIIIIVTMSILFYINTLDTLVENNKNFMTIKDNDSSLFELYVGTYVEGNRVNQLVRDLPGGNTIQELQIDNGKVYVQYKTKEGVFPSDNVTDYWYKENDTVKKLSYLILPC
ncbi:hypothetical protein [Halobacillus sp. BBL2006]|uniref:hypothetical protein n=1 Tax=Halobacillus sp. BBL2006 TaxID=1543706 RepID=UPI000543CCB8|nr:hypothetical protein [Halobacillus sp. BBL2006]KHE71942.1 hypothetical protein LD39_07155 [Halobacillus sp. BBL2006]